MSHQVELVWIDYLDIGNLAVGDRDPPNAGRIVENSDVPLIRSTPSPGMKCFSPSGGGPLGMTAIGSVL